MWPRRYGRRKVVLGMVKPRGRDRGVLVTWASGVVKSLSCRCGESRSSPRRRRPRTIGQEITTALFFGKHVFKTLTEPLLSAMMRTTGRGGQAIGCWDWSAATIARRTLPAHRPGRLPGAFIACANGNLVLEGASRLDAFSAYPVPTWLPGDALSRTTGTPEVGPPQSSRTRGDAPQVSCAHGR